MAETPDRTLPALVAAANTSQTIYTAGGAGTWTIVRSLIVANVTTNPVVVSVGIGTTNTDTTAKRVVSGATIQPGESLNALPAFVTLKGHASTPDLLYAVCDTANGVSVMPNYVTGP